MENAKKTDIFESSDSEVATGASCEELAEQGSWINLRDGKKLMELMFSFLEIFCQIVRGG